MKLSFRTMAANGPAQTGAQPGASYEVFEREASPDEAAAFLDRLVSSEDMIYLEDPACSVDVWKHDGSLWVEIYSAKLWATSQVSDPEVIAIINVLDGGGSFGNRIPNTNREWDAYAPLGDNAPIPLAAT